MRLDKYLANMNVGTRSEVKKIIKKGEVKVNDIIIKSAEYKVLEDDIVLVNDKEIKYEKYRYYMMNKPQGVISATTDKYDKTILDLMPSEDTRDLFPVGRLDKDTEGLLLITNDGELSHNLLSPKKHVDKTYFALIDGVCTQEDIIKFKEGLDIGEKNITLPSELEIIESAKESKIEVTIKEGKFHQVKRMFKAVDKEVVYLKRLRMKNLVLDPNLKLGEYRLLTEEEIAQLKN